MPRTRWIVLLAVLIAAAVAWTGWMTWSARTASAVTVTWSGGSPSCDGADVRRAGTRHPVIVATEGMRCVVTVRVENGSGRVVQVVEAVAPLVGPDTGAVVTAENADPARSGAQEGIDALLPLDRRLAAGRSTEFDIVLVLHPAGCNQGTLDAPGWPSVTVVALGRTHDLRSDRTFSFNREAKTPGCLQP